MHVQDRLRLTERQRSILLMRSRGLSNKQIADVLGVARSTMETHITQAILANDSHNATTLLCKFVREQCSDGVWE